MGSVYGYLGRNGAGKTTTIQMLMGLLSPTSGEVSVMGMDPFAQDVAMKRVVSYVPERVGLPEWMTVRELMGFGAGVHPGWDRALAEELRGRLELPAERKVGQLSRGMQGKAALLMALAPRPKLLILDDPTMGVDVVVRREFMESIVAALSDLGVTVFFSSHQLEDVERIADFVGVLHEGRLVVEAPLEELQEGVRRVVAVFPETAPFHLTRRPPGPLSPSPAADLGRGEKGNDRNGNGLLPGALQYRCEGRQHVWVVRGYSTEVLQRLHEAGAVSAEVQRCSLEDIFVALVRGEEDGA
ncbi:MAG TPA: ABC transporter ATP-binding protein [Tepidisphaeraceae bacterium]|nr:ABC transporter ATP-binding protein [Tepidisphaeraceae bacterium]